jgi:mannose-6-phosphate isomerase
MPQLYPLRFPPIYQYRLWGGRELAHWLQEPLPAEGPIGEAWVLSDRDDYPSRVADGPLAGQTIAELIRRSPQQVLGKWSGRFERFPLLLKFLDVQQMLSVQVHPSDADPALLPAGESGKTEAWIVLEAGAESRVYAGLKPSATREALRSLSRQNVDDLLASFRPERQQALLVEAGVVHSVGNGVVVLEVQQNSDVTFRLYDWEHVDPKTGQRRALQVEQALECLDPDQGVVVPVPALPAPVVVDGTSPPAAPPLMSPVTRELVIDCKYFRIWRSHAAAPFRVGADDEPRIVVCLDGGGSLEHDGSAFPMQRGAVFLLPACLGPCRLRPDAIITILEIAIDGAR